MLAGNLAAAVLVCAASAANDNNIEWQGVSHVAWQDRRPLCPVDGEAFDVVFKAYRFDLTSARVVVDDGDTPFTVEASFLRDDGPYAVWQAQIPVVGVDSFEYYIELTDGTDVDYLGPPGLGASGASDNPPASGWLIDFVTLEHAPIGATMLPDGGAVFKVWAPNPTTAYVRGEFNGWGTGNPMTKVGDYFIARVATADARDMYKYYFASTNTWKTDARARAINPSDNYNSHLEDALGYAWGDDDFETPPFEEMVIYELHVGTFSGYNDPVASGVIPGTYADVAVHVDHLVELGVNVVELMPINEYPWDFSAGYNPVSCWAPEWKHGTPDDLKYMIDVLHQNGIAVLQDIVWNHFSGSDNYLWNYTSDSGGTANQIYFDGDGSTCLEDTPWGCQADFDRLEVRDYFADSSLHWLEEYHFDGYRMDATDFMTPYQGWGWWLMRRFNEEMDARYVNKISIAEQLPDDTSITTPLANGGAGFDSQWFDAFVDNLRQEILDAGWNQSNVNISVIRDIINGYGTYLSNTRVVNYLEAHDEAWPESGGQRFIKNIDTSAPHDDIYAKGRIKLGQGIVMFAPGIPMILQGSEWLEDIDFGSGSPAGADRLDWNKKTTYAGIFDYFRDMIAIRRSNCVCRSDAAHQVFHENETDNVIAWQRYDLNGNILVIIASFSDNNFPSYLIDLPAGGTWYELLNSQATEYMGNGMTNGGVVVADTNAPHTASVVLPQMGLLVLRHENPPGRSGDLRGADGDMDLEDFAELQIQFGSNGCGLAADLDEDGRVDAVDAAEFVDVMGGPS